MTPKQKKAISTRMKAMWMEKKAARKKQVQTWGHIVKAVAAPDPFDQQVKPAALGGTITVEDLSYHLGSAVVAILHDDLDTAAHHINREIERRK